MLVDSHCHLNYLEDPTARLAAARSAGVGVVLCIGVDEARIREVLALAERETDVWASVGEHPEAAAAEAARNPGDWIEPLLSHPRVIAVGETGLDYYHEADPDRRRRQQQRFDLQLSLAARYRLPVVVHSRAAEADTLALLRAYPDATGVLHCFTESWEMARAALDLGYYVSISGIVTFRNGENVREVARRLPADRLLLETDAPWLAPEPHRGKPNEPAFVRHTAARVAELRGVDGSDLARTTTANFFRLFARAQNSSSNSR